MQDASPIRLHPTAADVTIAPEDSVMEAARRMEQLNVGALPVSDGFSIVGWITDRDITLGAAARGRLPRSMAVAEVMRWLDTDDDVIAATGPTRVCARAPSVELPSGDAHVLRLPR